MQNKEKYYIMSFSSTINFKKKNSVKIQTEVYNLEENLKRIKHWFIVKKSLQSKNEY
jgi:hypothetical protein